MGSSLSGRRSCGEHHDPTEVSEQEFDVLAAVYVANCLAHEQTDEAASWEGAVPVLNVDYVEKLGVGANQLRAWREIAALLAEARP